MRRRLSNDGVSRRSFLKRCAVSAVAFGGITGAAQARAQVAPGSSSRPNIVMISTDTTRADHLSYHGYQRRTSPVLDALAKESVVFKNAISTSSWTLPAHASMFTGKFVTTHGARKDPEAETNLGQAITGIGLHGHKSRSVTKEEVLLAQHLKEAGYQTGGVVSGPWLKKVFGLHTGFDFYDDDEIYGLSPLQKRNATKVSTRAIEWIDEVHEQPFFLFLNYFDPHGPFALPDEYKDTFKNDGKGGGESIRQYDAEILYMDFEIGRVFDRLRELGVYDNTMVIIIGDHGEMFGEHGVHGHGQYLYQGTQHIPFLIRYPRGEYAARELEYFVQPTEVLPAIFKRLDLPIPEGVQGSHWDSMNHPILAEVYPHKQESRDGHWQSLYKDDWKFMLNSGGDHQLINLRLDPREENNLYSKNVEKAGSMMRELLDIMSRLPRPQGRPLELLIDQQTLEELESLGYL